MTHHYELREDRPYDFEGMHRKDQHSHIPNISREALSNLNQISCSDRNRLCSLTSHREYRYFRRHRRARGVRDQAPNAAAIMRSVHRVLKRGETCPVVGSDPIFEIIYEYFECVLHERLVLFGLNNFKHPSDERTSMTAM